MMKVTYLNGTLEKRQLATIERIVSLIRKEKMEIPSTPHTPVKGVKGKPAISGRK